MDGQKRRGGRRAGAGRKPEYSEPLVITSVTLPASYVEELRRVGLGNVSNGLRLVLELGREGAGFQLPEASAPAEGQQKGRV